MDAATRLVVVAGMTQASHDKEQVEPMLAMLEAPAEVLGPVESLIADSGFCSEMNIKACEAAGIVLLIAVARDEHPPDWRQRHSEPAALPEHATPVQALSHCMQTPGEIWRFPRTSSPTDCEKGSARGMDGSRPAELRRREAQDDGLAHRRTGE